MKQSNSRALSPSVGSYGSFCKVKCKVPFSDLVGAFSEAKRANGKTAYGLAARAKTANRGKLPKNLQQGLRQLTEKSYLKTFSEG